MKQRRCRDPLVRKRHGHRKMGWPQHRHQPARKRRDWLEANAPPMLVLTARTLAAEERKTLAVAMQRLIGNGDSLNLGPTEMPTALAKADGRPGS